MYVLVNRETGAYVTADPSLDLCDFWSNTIKDAWILPNFSKAKEKQVEVWPECRVEEVPTWYTNVLQCAPLFEFMG